MLSIVAASFFYKLSVNLSKRSDSMKNFRLVDSGERVHDFLLMDVLIQCPQCARCAIALDRTDSQYHFQCDNCGILSEPLVEPNSKGSFRGFYLWLRTPVCGKMLWAYNREHLDFLDRYINAYLRERLPYKNQSLASRLPEWMKSAKNRKQLMKGINKLKDKLKEC
jgi:hypothetical protein